MGQYLALFVSGLTNDPLANYVIGGWVITEPECPLDVKGRFGLLPREAKQLNAQTTHQAKGVNFTSHMVIKNGRKILK